MQPTPSIRPFEGPGEAKAIPVAARAPGVPDRTTVPGAQAHWATSRGRSCRAGPRPSSLGGRAGTAGDRQEPMGEANIPAEPAQARQEARVSPSHVDASRAGHPQGPPSQGTPQAGRLTGRVGRIGDRHSFEALASQGRRSRSGAVTVTFVPGSPQSPTRVAYAIGRRAGGAVHRNRLRRRLRAVMAEAAPTLRPGDYLVSAGPGAGDVGYQELTTMTTAALRRLHETARSVPPAGS